jgi:hypothetical protein
MAPIRADSSIHSARPLIVVAHIAPALHWRSFRKGCFIGG